MLKKLFFILIVIIVFYGIIVFRNPELADTIESKLGISINSSLRENKQKIDDFSTSLPDKADIIQKYEPIIDSARDATNTVIERANDVKNKVDDVRTTLSGAEETVNKAIDTIDEINKLGNDVKNIISSGSTN